MTQAEEGMSKEYHQAVAMLHARSIRSMYSKRAKQKARSECLAHLRASLCPAAATVEQILKNTEASV
jgi:hypothetical protein